MATRIRRNRPSPGKAAQLSRIEELMKSISNAQTEANRLGAQVKAETLELYTLMKSADLSRHTTADATADVYRSAGRGTNVVDPQGFRRLVKNDKEFFSAVTVSVTEARKVLPQKQLDTITTMLPGKPGEETVKVVARGS